MNHGAQDALTPQLPDDGHEFAYLQNTARHRKNLFAASIETLKTRPLGQIGGALYDVGGAYRRNM